MLTEREKHKYRARSQKAYPLTPDSRCEWCGGALGKIPRHHPDLESRPDYCIILCDPCHIAEDTKLGKRGEGARAAKYQHTQRPEPPLLTTGNGPPLIHLIGPSGAGKTELAKRYCEEHVGYTHAKIDDFHNNIDAMLQHIRKPLPVIVESSGLNKDVAAICARAVKLGRRRACTVRIRIYRPTAKRNILQRGTQPKWGRMKDLCDFAVKCCELLPGLYPHARVIEYDPEGMYDEFCSVISMLESEQHRAYIRLL